MHDVAIILDARFGKVSDHDMVRHRARYCVEDDCEILHFLPFVNGSYCFMILLLY